MYREKKISDFPIVTYGIRYSIYLILAGLAISFWNWAVALILVVPLAFVLYFFRNPRRRCNAGPDDILSPADGKVLSITEIDENDFINGKAVNVSIFLSVFNVHINRSPIAGEVKYHAYRDGQMLPAFKSHASDINERNTIGIESEGGFKILVHQITGFIARRIVWWVKPADHLAAGERFGLIKFGSCTQIVVPLGTKILVEVGQVVRAGKTKIGEIQK